MKKFDLNIEKILENWETYHGIREIISNALDEQKLTKTEEIKIFKDENNFWHIRDYGRGITIEHFSQNENEEKLNADGIIGKFGIGLKDALATFDRKNINVKIISRHGEFTIGKAIKVGFDDISTLHIYFSETDDKNFIGTDFIISNLSDTEMEKAKDMFLDFSGETEIEKCSYGNVLNKKNTFGRIYINGVKVNVEENFLFSYNITNLNSSINKALNRERTNVGRAAYSSTIKSILLNCKGHDIATKLINDFKNYSYGSFHDELNWIDVQEHAVKIMNNNEKVVFVTSDEIASSPDLIDEVKSSGYTMVNIPTNLKLKIQGQTDVEGNVILEFNQFKTERNENFEFKFVSIEKLNKTEKENFKLINHIISLVGNPTKNLKKIYVSETMQRDDYNFRPSEGLFQASEQRIIIKRSILSNRKRFIAVLLHEIAHVKSGASDATRAFEDELTSYLGIIGIKALDNKKGFWASILKK
ncbi:MAG: ATP-binding protein [Ignavibacteriales bacterium]|nr:ATP-binding protein [Ignavibacteriota bacterium]MCB9250791.1 ATP-binding protein [Ignavibacteriales bacterium]